MGGRRNTRGDEGGWPSWNVGERGQRCFRAELSGRLRSITSSPVLSSVSFEVDFFYSFSLDSFPIWIYSAMTMML
jgi:hypothetical protein